MKQPISLTINGETREVYVSVHRTLLEVLREDLALTGTKHGCELGECGTCSVLIDGAPALSCLILPIERQAASPADGLRRTGRGAVRLLHARHPRHRQSAARPRG